MAIAYVYDNSTNFPKVWAVLRMSCEGRSVVSSRVHPASNLSAANSAGCPDNNVVYCEWLFPSVFFCVPDALLMSPHISLQTWKSYFWTSLHTLVLNSAFLQGNVCKTTNTNYCHKHCTINHIARQNEVNYPGIYTYTRCLASVRNFQLHCSTFSFCFASQ